MATQSEKEKWDRELEIYDSIRTGWYWMIERTAGVRNQYRTFEEFFKKEILVGNFDLIVEGACGSNGFPCLDILKLGYQGKYLRVDEAGPCPPVFYSRWLSEKGTDIHRLEKKFGFQNHELRERCELLHDEALLGSKVRKLLREAKNPLLLSNLALVRSLKIQDFAWYDWRDFNQLPYRKQIHIHPFYSGVVVSQGNAELILERFKKFDLGDGLVAVDLISAVKERSEESYDLYALRKILDGFKEYGWQVDLPFQDCLVLAR